MAMEGGWNSMSVDASWYNWSINTFNKIILDDDNQRDMGLQLIMSLKIMASPVYVSKKAN